MTADDLVSRLDGAKRTGEGRWMARCPAHGDKRPSLSIRDAGEGRTLVYCFAGCHVDAVLNAVGLTVADLFPPREGVRYDVRQARSGIHPMDVLHCIAHEARVVLIVGRTIEDGEALSGADLQRVSLATQRIGSALDVCHV